MSHRKAPSELLLDLGRSCLRTVEEEQECDTLEGPDSPACERLFLHTEDCFQRSLCQSRWKEALNCIQEKNPEACEHLIIKSRACKDKIFRKLLTPALSEYLKNVAQTNEQCERDLILLKRCRSIVGKDYPECLELEILYKECYYGNSVPRELWKEWKTCSAIAGDDATEICVDELEDIRLALRKRAENVCQTIPALKDHTNMFGGPEGMLENLTKLFYGSHCGLFKDYDPRIGAFRNTENTP
eukprot:TRINITY_DN10734_c0_g3_i6.p1 TRINITY_DN10734_c0_g3~~TRINITY_DN10734_c0_g3_i6.p1  ORF type:complete len:243 (+),score=49.61 TRINITY_DN10734_c0_g3_i6:108-836(+)